jgi:GNAT superfamily N-acetyltransferase
MFSISHDASESLGFLSLKSHTILDAEIYLIAVRPAFHGQGLGHALIAHAARYARNHGAKFMTVKTVGPSCPSPEYEMTRRFYLSAGFVPLKEFDDLWEGTPCLLMMKLL